MVRAKTACDLKPRIQSVDADHHRRATEPRSHGLAACNAPRSIQARSTAAKPCEALNRDTFCAIAPAALRPVLIDVNDRRVACCSVPGQGVV
jgi:hypothetical protein